MRAMESMIGTIRKRRRGEIVLHPAACRVFWSEMFRFVLLLACLAGISARADGPETAMLDRWIERQAEIRTLSADFTQTRALRVLRSPVAARGRLWFQAPGDFRWEVGAPPKIVVLRKDRDCAHRRRCRQQRRSRANAECA